MNARLVSLASVSLILTGAILSAQTIPGRELPRLVDRADIIVLGTIGDLTDLGLASPADTNGSSRRVISGEIDVRQVLKGPRDLTSVRFQSPVWATALTTGKVTRNAFGVLLLKREGDDIVFADPNFPIFGAVAGPRIEASDPLEAVITAIASPLSAPAASTSMKRIAIRQLWNVPTPAAVAGLRQALRDQDRTIQLAAVGSLLSDNDVEALPIAEAVLMQPAGAESITAADLRLGLQLGLRGLKDPRAEPALIRLLNRAEVGTRRTAAVALGQMRSKTALRALGRALEDEDFEVRFNAVWGIADATGQGRLKPSWEDFREEEVRHKSDSRARLASLGIEVP